MVGIVGSEKTQKILDYHEQLKEEIKIALGGKSILKTKVPIKTVSEANKREHWTKPHKRAKAQKDAVRWYLGQEIMQTAPEVLKMRPIDIHLTRIAPRKLDCDNNQMSLKACRDAVADLFNPGLMPGRADDDPKLFWYYGQKKGKPKEYAVEIEIRKKESL